MGKKGGCEQTRRVLVYGVAANVPVTRDLMTFALLHRVLFVVDRLLFAWRVLTADGADVYTRGSVAMIDAGQRA
jgi:hypothetical protein